MRIWSLHPKYLDAKGLVALWRETLLAKHVLEGRTKGYLHHPQLGRFKRSCSPQEAIDQYLYEVYNESVRRQYHFDKNKFRQPVKTIVLTVTLGQIEYEFRHLLSKLRSRDPGTFNKIGNTKIIDPHPLFTIIRGPVESWEKITSDE